MIQVNEVQEKKSWHHAHDLFDSYNLYTDGNYPRAFGSLSAFVSTLFIEMSVFHPEAFNRLIQIKERHLKIGEN